MLDGLSRVNATAPFCPIWRVHNHCNFGLCCQQPQRSPQAKTETLLAVAVHQSDGRVDTLTLPLPNTHSPLSLCTVPSVCPHEAVPLLQCCPPRRWFSALLLLSLVSVSSGSCFFFPYNILFPSFSLPLQTFTFNSASWFLPKASPSHHNQGEQGGSLMQMSPDPCMWWHVERLPTLRSPCPFLCRNLAAGVL